MLQLPYLNIHAHSTSNWLTDTIYSFDYQQIQLLESHPTQYSVGMHPWNLQMDRFDSQLEQLELILQNPSIKLLGECGLDRLRGPEIKLQWQALEDQTDLAIRTNRPMILHCVRAFDLLLAFRKKQHQHIPMIIHGFRGSIETAKQLTNKGYLLSFGPVILNQQKKAKSLLNSIQTPFFLETDDHTMPIEIFYHQIAILLHIEVDELKDRIFAAWKLIGLQKNE